MRSKFKWIFTLVVVLIMQFTYAQVKTVTGVVSDASGTLPGANVVVKGTKTSTQTDLDGKFSIKAKAGDVLVISFVGNTNSQIVIGAADSYKVKMSSGKELNEVFVLGYGQTKKRNEMTGDVVKVGGDVINKVPMVSIDQALQGKVVGLTISATSGTPGALQEIRIRGAQSLYAGSEPLYVVDGVPVVSGDVSGGGGDTSGLSILSTISADNIESMTVLKDASATSIYGARGTNGVILITTKKGKNGATKFSFSSSVGFQNNATKGLRPLTGAEKKTLLEDGVYNTFGDSGNNFTRSQAYDYIVNNGISQPLIDWVNAGSKEYNWSKLLQRKDATLKSLDFSVQGGDQKQNFYASLGYNKTEGVGIGTDFRRVSAALNYSNQLTDRTKFTNTMSVTNILHNGVLDGVNGSAFFSNPAMAKYFMNPWVSPFNADGSPNFDITVPHNALYTATHDSHSNDLTRVINNTTINYDLLKNLKFTSSLGIDYSLTTYHNYANPFHGDGFDYGGWVNESYDINFKYVAQNSLDYSFQINDDNKFDAKILMEFDKTKYKGIYGYGDGLVRPEFIHLDGTSANYQASSYFYDSSNLGYLGVVNYKFKNKYVLDVTGRSETSSKFNPESRTNGFYSVGAAWNLNKESFLASIESIDLLRLRGSYGTTGNSSVSINGYQSFLGAVNYNGVGGLSPSSFGGKIKWELAKKFDAGVEFELFKNTVKGSLVYYKSITSQMLQPTMPLSPTQGFDSYTTNSGVMYNKGIEATINLDIIRTKDFNWSIGGNFATLKNQITDLKFDNGAPRDITTGTRRNEEGHPMFEWYMRTWAGVDPANGSPLWFVNGTDGATTSDYNTAKVAYQGKNALPTYSGGFNSHFDVKNFFFDFSFYFAGGNKVYQNWASYTSSAGPRSIVNYNGTEDLLNRWQNPGDITDVPKMEYTLTTSANAALTSSRFLYDGDFVRLRDITVGYNFKADVLSKVKLDGLSFSVRGTNMLTWVKDSRLKYDPEVSTDGFTSLTTPPVKSVVFSVNVKF